MPQHAVLSLRVGVCSYVCKQISVVNCGVLTVGGVSGFVYGTKVVVVEINLASSLQASNFVNNFTAVCNTAFIF